MDRNRYRNIEIEQKEREIEALQALAHNTCKMVEELKEMKGKIDSIESNTRQR